MIRSLPLGTSVCHASSSNGEFAKNTASSHLRFMYLATLPHLYDVFALRFRFSERSVALSWTLRRPRIAMFLFLPFLDPLIRRVYFSASQSRRMWSPVTDLALDVFLV